MNTGLFLKTLDMFTYQRMHHLPVHVKKNQFRQTDTLHCTQCSSSSWWVVLTAERCFWQVTVAAGLVKELIRESQKPYMSKYSRRASVLLSSLNLHLLKSGITRVNIPKTETEKNSLSQHALLCFLLSYASNRAKQTRRRWVFPHFLFSLWHNLCTVWATWQ